MRVMIMMNNQSMHDNDTVCCVLELTFSAPYLWLWSVLNTPSQFVQRIANIAIARAPVVGV